ncbi:MAG: radical SAM protein [Candidatus Tectomicrobia bacterium]|uniref:Radical SAM protein n=1 Tax=Tectimicrobiota bacterium TaxID=2528274 RepID=A0A933GMY4_UNCTE|nr:radical SAM protein [Candidatus Tectomicrobia bacterium]
MTFEAAYLKLYREGILLERVKSLWKILESCTLCPRQCRINRLDGERGFCQTGKDLHISSSFPHFGEEPPLVGQFGSGTIFLTYCNLLCVFCQNYDISHLGHGQKISLEQMADSMLQLQQAGCHNINFVTPTHFVPQIISALPLAIKRGLHLPLVYNCSGYESPEVLRLLQGIVDIYMPDAKFSQSEAAGKYCHAEDYPIRLKENLKEMHGQVGDLQINSKGIAERGLLIRHLVMPDRLAGTEELMSFIAKELSPTSYVNIMSQYRPCYQAKEFEEINRRLTTKEFLEAIVLARKTGLTRGFGM